MVEGSATIGPGAVAHHPGCDVPVESFESVLAESVRVAGHYVFPGVDLEPWNERTRPISYDYTFQPCGHTVRHYVGSDEVIYEVTEATG